jgi:nitrate/TMAO reductase-like tetraheme cytochrome c subunit
LAPQRGAISRIIGWGIAAVAGVAAVFLWYAANEPFARREPFEAPQEMRPLTLTELLDNPEVRDPVSAVGFYSKGDFSILLSYDSRNKIETCGCSPLQLGGIAPRVALIKIFQARGGSLVFDAGSVSDGAESFQTLKFQTMLRAMREAPYNGVNLGVTDMAYAPDELAALFRDAEVPLYSANVLAKEIENPLTGNESLYDYPPYIVAPLPILEFPEDADGQLIAPPSVIALVNGKRAGVVFLQFTQMTKDFERHPGYVIVEPEAAFECVKRVTQPEPEFWVLVAEGYGHDIEKFVEEHPEILIVLTGNKHIEEEKNVARSLANGGIWFNTFFYGKYLGLISIDGEPGNERRPAKFEGVNIPIQSTYYSDLAVYDMIKKDLHSKFEAVFREQSFEFKAANIIPPEECKDCHAHQYEVFVRSAHPNSRQILKDAGQQYNVDCLSCHVVYDYTNDLMYAMQCISCHQERTPIHGFKQQAGEPEDLQPTAKATYEFCARCHNPENSTRFKAHLKEYLDAIKHWD